MAKFGNNNTVEAPEVGTVEADLLEVTTELYKADKNFQKWEAKKKEYRKDFFDVLTKKVEQDEILNVQTVKLGPDYESHVKREYPLWRIVDVARCESCKSEAYDVVLEEDPEFIKHSFVNPENGKVFARQIAMVGSSFDSEKFWADYPEEAPEFIHLTAILKYGLGEERGLIVSETESYTLSEDALEDFVNRNPDWTPIIQEYITPGKPQVRLAKIADAKEKDLV